jgi:hypothetical protein
MPSTQARPGRRRAHRWRSLAVLVLPVLLLVAGGVALVLWLSGRSQEPSAAERVQQCQTEHEVDDAPMAAVEDQVLERCAWPAPGDNPDGYHEIAVTIRELEGDEPLVAYTFAAPCERLSYELSGGPAAREVDAGQVVDGRTGGPVKLTSELLELVPELSPGTLAVLTSPGQPVVDVACVV